MMIVGHDENKFSRIILSREAFFIFIYMARSLKSFIYIKTTKNNTGHFTSVATSENRLEDFQAFGPPQCRQEVSLCEMGAQLRSVKCT